MKKRTKRIFISLLTLLVAGMAATHAYIFDVENWQPFGVLNLTKLILKPNTTQTGIILDGENYIIKIDPNNDIPDGGQIRVYEICDENGNNCKKISNLNGEGNGQCYDGISAGGITGEYCYLLQDGNLWCDNSGLPSGSSPYILPVAGNILGGIMLGYTTDYTGKRYAVQLDDNNKAFVQVPRAGGNGNTIISGAQILNGTNGYLCTKQDDNLVCNINPNNLGNGGGISVDGITEYICRLMGDGNLKCDINPNELGVGNGGGTPIEGAHGKRCKYMCEMVVINGKETKLGELSQEDIDKIIANAREDSDVSREGCRVECYEDDPNGGGGGGGDVFRWGNLAGINPTIYPVSKNYNVRIGGNTKTSYKLFVNGSTAVEPDNDVTLYKNLPDFKVTQSGIAVFGGITYGIEGTDGLIRRALSVHGPIIAGNNSNHISMYADGDFGDEERRFEIMGNNELAIGTEFGAFIYFTQLTGEFRTDLEYASAKEPGTPGPGKGAAQQYDYYDISTINLENPVHAYESLMVGVNTNNPFATLDVNGSLKIGHNCVPGGATCEENKEGTMMYFVNTSNIGVLAVCTKTTGGGHKRINLLKTSEQGNKLVDIGYPNDDYCYIPKPHPGDPFGGVAVQEIDSLIDNQD